MHARGTNKNKLQLRSFLWSTYSNTNTFNWRQYIFVVFAKKSCKNIHMSALLYLSPIWESVHLFYLFILFIYYHTF
jgi:hypothetical protein